MVFKRGGIPTCSAIRRSMVSAPLYANMFPAWACVMVKSDPIPTVTKVEGFCALVRKHVPSVNWLWIDTCCIDQKSSSEVQETVNSMFKWYRTAVVCLAYLEDVTQNASDGERNPNIVGSVWFYGGTRGWTLQELLAPHVVIFLTKEWQTIGHKGDSV